MNTQEPSEPQGNPPPMAQPVPPISPPPYAPPPRQTNWPTVLGIIAIILGVLGILGVFGQVVMAFMQSAIKPPPGQGPDFAAMQPPMPWLVISGILSLAMGVLVLVGGIGLTQRRRWSASTIRLWAIAHILFLVVNIAVTYTSMAGAMQKAQQDAAAAGTPAEAMLIGVFAGMCGGALFGLAPPIFALVWFGRRKIKDEVAGWT